MRSTRLAFVLVAASCGVTGPTESNIPLGLYVSSSVTPTTLSITDTVTALNIRVTVVNPSTVPIILNPDRKEGFRIGRPGNPTGAGPYVDSDPSAADTFPPYAGMYAEYQVTLKMWRAGGWPTDTGTYTVRSYYGGQEGASSTFRLVP